MVCVPYLNTTETFDPDSFDAEVIRLAISLDNHNSGSHRHQRGNCCMHGEAASGSPWRTGCACFPHPEPFRFRR
jgi:hypothetical protein